MALLTPNIPSSKIENQEEEIEKCFLVLICFLFLIGLAPNVDAQHFHHNGSLHRPQTTRSFEELLMSQVVSQDALIRLLIAKGLFTKEEFLEMVKAVDREMKKRHGDQKEGK